MPRQVRARTAARQPDGDVIFSGELLQALDGQQLLGQHALELGVLGLQFLEPLGLGHVHVAELVAPAKESLLGDVVALADLADRLLLALGFARDAHHLLVGKSLLHELSLFEGYERTHLPSGYRKRLRSRGREVNARFRVMCARYLYDPDFCNVASGWEKRFVEKNVQYNRRRVWLDAARQRFGSLTKLNASPAERCSALWSELRYPEHSAFGVAEMLEREGAHLLPVAQPFDCYVERMARVRSICLVSVARSSYSMPCEWVGQMVSTRLYPGQVVLVANDGIMARHERLSNKGETRYDWQRYIPKVQWKPGALMNGAPFQDLPEPLKRLRRLLLREVGGDRVMAQVLAVVPTAGLEAVLVASEPVTEISKLLQTRSTADRKRRSAG